MDRTQQLYYEMKFRVQWRDAFQRLFEQLMSKRYPGDFMACKLWGASEHWETAAASVELGPFFSLNELFSYSLVNEPYIYSPNEK